MIFFAYQFSRKGPKENQSRPYESDISPTQAFTLSASINIIGMWGALPYFAAIAQILKANLETASMVWSLFYYNLIFALPLLGFIVLRALMGNKAAILLDSVNEFFTLWGKRTIVLSLYLLGPLLITDGIGWFAGYPILDFTE